MNNTTMDTNFTPAASGHPWEIWLIQHTHVDLGYTEPQDIVFRKHAEFIAQALDHCTATDELPAGERFCWTCEVSWTVKAFLQRFPERAAEFFRRVREGRIEITALHMNLTDLCTLETLEETTEYALELARRNDFELTTAMNSDVNGWAWGLPDLLAHRGIRYMDVAINETRSLGVRPCPTMLKWIGPNGGALRLWHGQHYMTGNLLDIGAGQSGRRLAETLAKLVAEGYPHHAVAFRIQGATHDNAPPNITWCEAARSWNAAHSQGPRLRLGTTREWFE